MLFIHRWKKALRVWEHGSTGMTSINWTIYEYLYDGLWSGYTSKSQLLSPGDTGECLEPSICHNLGGRGTLLDLVSRDQGSYSAQDSPSQQKNDLAQNVRSARGEELWADSLFSPHWQIAEVGDPPTDNIMVQEKPYCIQY